MHDARADLLFSSFNLSFSLDVPFFTIKTYVKLVENFVLGKLLHQAFGSLLECFYRGLAPVSSFLNQFSIFVKFPT